MAYLKPHNYQVAGVVLCGKIQVPRYTESRALLVLSHFLDATYCVWMMFLVPCCGYCGVTFVELHPLTLFHISSPDRK
jgi:hypothetical protein